jgi:ubiquinone/menaquinone biosynthesis C-methylase UbiE
MALSAPSLFQLGYYWEAKIFLVSVRLDIYTAIAERHSSAEAIAAFMKTDPAFTGRLLDALVTIGLLTHSVSDVGERIYANTPVVSEFLVITSPFYMGELMLFQDAEREAWGNHETIIRSGRSPIAGNLFMNRPDLGEMTLKVLHRMGQRVAPGLANKIDLSAYRTFLDVGGGAGTFSIAFCKRYPHLQSTLFDLPQTLTTTQKNIEREKLTDRIRLVSGNFNEDPILASVGTDVVFLSDILHYQTDEENAALFQKLYKITNPNGIIVVKDMFLGEEAPGWNAIFSIHMMVYSEKGRCFKGSQITRWLEAAGFREVREVERNTVLVASK